MTVQWNCIQTADRLHAESKIKVEELRSKGIEPQLVVVLVGNNPASQVYVRNKIKACGALGIKSQFHELPAETETETLRLLIDELNQDPAIHGILVQLPLPKQIDEATILSAIHPDKDVDGFHPINVGRLSLGNRGLFPCTPMGVMALLKDAGVALSGLHAAVIGRSNIVGKPMASLLLQASCTVSILHSRTRDPQALCRQADIVVAAVGRPGLIDESWLKPGALVVDVGINLINDPAEAARLLTPGSKKAKAFERDGHVLFGDVHFERACTVARLVTPVPNGVGKLTIAQLMANCVTAAGFKA